MRTPLNEFCKIAGNQQRIFSFLSRPNLQFCRSLNTFEREEGNAHSPPDIHYSKEPNKGKRLMRRPSPSQEPAGKTNTDAAEKNSAGDDSAILRGQSGRERGVGGCVGWLKV
jgi:hypothetical protein